MKTQRVTALSSLALVGALALTACGGSGSSNSSSTGSANASTSGSASGSAAAAGDCATGNLKAEGSSAQKNAFEEAVASYGETCKDVQIDYQPSGSGAGIKALVGGLADFAGSDSALKTEAKDGKIEVDQAKAACGSPAWNIPMVTGPIAISYNLAGVEGLTLTPSVASKIFLGKITKWNDPAIAALNSGVSLPDQAIKVFFRSDESGTTENFEKYLKAAAPADFNLETSKTWKGTVGEGKPKSDGVATAVKSTAGGITYVEWSYAKDNQLGIAKIDNGGGAVELSAESVGKAVEAAKADGEGNDLRLKLDYATKAAGAYPIILVTYEIVCSDYKDDAKATNVRSFLTHFASADVQNGLEEIGYAPLPESVRTKVDTAIAAIK